MTHREFLVRMKHKELQEDKTTADQWYLMQIARQVACVLHPEPQKVKLSDFKLELVRQGDKKKKPSQKKKKDIKGVVSKAVSRWGNIVGLKNGKRN